MPESEEVVRREQNALDTIRKMASELTVGSTLEVIRTDPVKEADGRFFTVIMKKNDSP